MPDFSVENSKLHAFEGQPPRRSPQRLHQGCRRNPPTPCWHPAAPLPSPPRKVHVRETLRYAAACGFQPRPPRFRASRWSIPKRKPAIANRRSRSPATTNAKPKPRPADPAMKMRRPPVFSHWPRPPVATAVAMRQAIPPEDRRAPPDRWRPEPPPSESQGLPSSQEEHPAPASKTRRPEPKWETPSCHFQVGQRWFLKTLRHRTQQPMHPATQLLQASSASFSPHQNKHGASLGSHFFTARSQSRCKLGYIHHVRYGSSGLTDRPALWPQGLLRRGASGDVTDVRRRTEWCSWPDRRGLA